ncbi:MAG: response regulator [Candidatus Poribacteria bacterium]|nr:response regulator [Candidatus Poribacteria bacterium]
MNKLKIMFIEDDEDAQELFIGVVDVFNRKNQQHNLKVEYKIAADPVEASDIIDSSYDGAIIDLKLDDDDEAGNRIVKDLYETFTRIPIIFVTAFADLVNDHPSVIKTRRREDGTYESDLQLFQQIQDTGLTRIIGNRGVIEQQLREVFLKNLLPQIETWISYGETYKETDPDRTEKALLRHALNHLYQLLEDNERYFPEEVYLHPPMLDKITTGSMVKANNQWFVVLSPACDLVIREDGKYNTDCILFAEIERVKDALDGSKSKGKVTELCTNKHTYRHWLPKTDFFEGGVLNFRKLASLNKDDFDKKFGKPIIQISPFFIKDIISRFSSYYARQGQPDIDKTAINDFITRYTT